jgi:uncharacterized membrane protein (UPF0136 family)
MARETLAPRRRPLLVSVAIAAGLFWAVYLRDIPGGWFELSFLAAFVTGALIGMFVTRTWAALAAVPLIAFAVGGLLLATHFSRSRPLSGGGDWWQQRPSPSPGSGAA